VTSLDGIKKGLETQVAELRNKVEMVEKRAVERKALEDKKQKEEVDFLKYQGQQLDSFLRHLSASK